MNIVKARKRLPPGFDAGGHFIPLAIELFYEDFGYLTVDVDDIEA